MVSNISADSAIVPQPHFETGVVKIQEKRFHALTDCEKVAVAFLKKISEETNERNEQLSNMSVLEKIKIGKRKQREAMSIEEEYMDADFILASTAIVERLWSLAGHILTDTRKQMTPIVFESLIFLKLNERFWDQELLLVSKAVSMARTERSQEQERLERDLQQQQMMVDDTDEEAGEHDM